MKEYRSSANKNIKFVPKKEKYMEIDHAHENYEFTETPITNYEKSKKIKNY